MNTRQEQILFELEQKIVTSHLVSELQEKLNNNPENLSLLEKAFLFLATNQTHNAIELKKEIEQYNNSKKNPEENLANPEENLTGQHPSFGAFSSFSPEIFQHLESFLPKNDLYALRMTSKQIKIWVDDYLARFDLIKNITESPFAVAIELIKNFRTSEQYKILEQSQNDDQVPMKDRDIIVYALTTNDITKINFTRLDIAIENLKDQAKEIQNVVKLSSINSLIKSLTLTSLAGKLSLLKPTLLACSDQIKVLNAKHSSYLGVEGFVTKMINQNPDLYSNLLLSNEDLASMKQNYSPGYLLNGRDEFDFLLFPTEKFPNLTRLFYSTSRFEFQFLKLLDDTEVDLVFCNLAGSCLTNMEFSPQPLKFVNLENANLRKTTIYSDLSQTYLKNTDLTDANLTYSSFGSNLLTAKFQGAKLVSLFNKFNTFDKFEIPHVLNELQQKYFMLKGKNNNGQDIGKLLVQMIINQCFQLSRDPETLSAIHDLITDMKKIDIFKPVKHKKFNSSVFSKESSGYELLKIYEKELLQQLKQSKDLVKKQSRKNNRWI